MVSPTPAAPSLLADPGYPSLKKHLLGITGLDHYAGKDEDLAGRIGRRLAARGVRDCTTYLGLLLDGPAGEAELDALIGELTIGETYFFRHRELFEALGSIVLPDVLQRNRSSRRLRIWSAGCATGAEPYSVAILLKRDFAPSLAGWDVSIVATDINRDFLARAETGQFEEWALRSAEDLKRTCFLAAGRSWLLAAEYREWVQFQYHNLVRQPFPSLLNNLFAFDVILCRNVLIYFSQEIIQRLIGQFRESLVEGGWLLVGSAEPNIEWFRSFQTVNAPGAVLYQKKGASPRLSWTVGAAGAAATGASTILQSLPLPACPPVAAAPAVPTAIPAAPTAPPVRRVADIRFRADQGDLEGAERCCRELLETDRLNPVVHFYHSLVQTQRGRHAEAEEALRRALYLDRTFVLAHYYLGLLQQQRGQARQATRSFRNVLDLLVGREASQIVADADGITVADLDQMTRMHLQVLEGR